MKAHFIPAPFRFCLQCGVAYGGRARSDFPKLGTLGSEGRSTATTILGLSTVRHLNEFPANELAKEARKLLSFTDNRQDASLQAGHFNDFVQVGLLRSALYRAAAKAGPTGLTHEVLTQRVFDALNLPLDQYATDPTVKFAALQQTQKALRDVIGYRLYLDLRRGWRITSPNLEQTGLLRIEYESLDDVAADTDTWKDCHAALVTAKPDTRKAIARVLLDYLRRELAIKVDYLDANFQEQLAQISSQKLKTPWALDENETFEFATTVFPRAKGDSEYRGWTFLSARGGVGGYLRRRSTFPDFGQKLTLVDTELIIRQLLECLRVAGLVERVKEAKDSKDANEVHGYQVPASSMRWVAGEGKALTPDPIRVPNPPAEGSRPNQFFLAFYKTVAADGQGLEAREHTAQVPYEAREDREKRFYDARLPILFCSPTMELGVDIASLNVVNLRNVPPSPANYAQRSGRAGRSGQPALVVTYCSGGSPHDQYFFRRPHRMVSGQVTPPRLDLANEDLVRAHVHSVWLAETGMSLGRSLKDLLDVGGEPPSLQLQAHVKADVDKQGARDKAKARAVSVLATVESELKDSNWWGPTWLDDAFRTLGTHFEHACERWRSLYRAARAQADAQNKIILDASRSAKDKNEAKKLRREAEAQLDLLTATGAAIIQSDFYSYRYFASEGFLPGYSFPRLPLSAFIPARRQAQPNDEFLSRPRFLAISEFGPQNFIYHEGSRYVINRVILPVADAPDPVTGRTLITSSAKICVLCGYLHPLPAPVIPDKCQHCGNLLGPEMKQLFRLQNVTTKRRDRINSDEEERQRMGYRIESAVRFAESGGRVACQTATIASDEGPLAILRYGHAATIWRVNYGWKRSAPKGDLGFVLDVERGYWAKDKANNDEDEPEDVMSPRTQRVVPYVEDRKNCLILEWAQATDQRVMASLQAALKHAIEVEFQLEDTELAAEPLPKGADRRYILFYESAEGGAGVLRQIVEDNDAVRRVAKTALEICHFDPDTGADKGQAPGAKEKCEAACYDCLMSYTNQPDHSLLDRKLLSGHLLALTKATVSVAPTALTREQHFERLARAAASDLERKWLRHLLDGGYRLPTDVGVLIKAAGTRPDFLYKEDQLAVYVDGPPHNFKERQERDERQEEALKGVGFTVVRFDYREDWDAILREYPSVFGTRRPD
jgi:very-short-patch-repair endonuclease